MFNLKPGMKVIVYRKTPVRLGEHGFYSSSYPGIGWEGYLRELSHNRDREWIIDWDRGTLDYEEDDSSGLLSPPRPRGDLVMGWMVCPIFPDNHIFTVGETVAYVSNRFGDSISNPLLFGKFGVALGIVKKVSHNVISVAWQIKNKVIVNNYASYDVIPANWINNFPRKNIKKEVEELCAFLYR